MRLPASSTGPEQHRSFVSGKRIPPTLQNEMAELLADVVHSLVSSKLEKMIDRMRGSSPRREEPLALVELGSSRESLARLLARLNETVLRVGPLELDLIDRVAKRGDRQFDLRPREFQLLKYMMQRSDKLLTRAALLKEVWHYKFIPETNLVDVHMGRLRRKLDGANEAPMIRSVRGVGFVLDAAPPSPPKKHTSMCVPNQKSPSAIENDHRHATAIPGSQVKLSQQPTPTLRKGEHP
jgi:DNA-binding winged helix-turn-helix (wHTH) protein